MQRVLLAATVLGLVGLVIASRRPAETSSAARETLDPSKFQSPEQLHGHVNVWGWNIAAKSLDSLVPEFRKRHPHVQVDVQMSGANMQTRFLLSLASGTGAPDIMQLQAYESPRYMATSRLTDLTSVAAKYGSSFAPLAWANCVQEGHIYAIPWDIGPCAVFYKPELFARYGIDPAQIETWDDFIAAGKRIVRASNGRTKMLPMGSNVLQPMYEILIQQAHGQVFDAQGRVAVNSAASRRVLELMRRMIDSGICANISQFSQEWMAGLNDDRIATYPGAVWLGGTIKDTAGDYGAHQARWRVFPLPALERGGLRTSNLGGSVLVIPKQSASKEAAWAFIEYALCTSAGQIRQYQSYDLFPALIPALSDPSFQRPDPFFGGQNVARLFASGIQDIPVLNRTTDWVEASNYLGQSLSAWAAGHEDAGEMLDRLSGKLQRRLGRDPSPEVQP